MILKKRELIETIYFLTCLCVSTLSTQSLHWWGSCFKPDSIYIQSDEGLIVF